MPHTPAQIESLVIDIVCRMVLPPTIVTKQSRLRADLHLESIDRMSLAIDLDDAFGITVHDEPLLTAMTVDDLVQMVNLSLDDRAAA